MKAIIQSYSPEEIERIARGEQTIKVCKTAPKDTPFKVYMYETQGATETPWVDEDGHFVWKGRGKVVGEYVCDRVETYEANDRGWYIYPQDEVCMWTDEIAGYGKGKPLRGLHITAVKFYDEPKELSEFRQACKIFNKRVCGLKTLCGEQKGICDGTKKLTRPPLAWQYVEEL